MKPNSIKTKWSVATFCWRIQSHQRGFKVEWPLFWVMSYGSTNPEESLSTWKSGNPFRKWSWHQSVRKNWWAASIAWIRHQVGQLASLLKSIFRDPWNSGIKVKGNSMLSETWAVTKFEDGTTIFEGNFINTVNGELDIISTMCLIDHILKWSWKPRIRSKDNVRTH